MIDEKALADPRARVDVDSALAVRVLGDDPWNHGNAEAAKLVGDSIGRNRLNARIAEDDLFDAGSGRVTIVRGAHVGVENSPELGDLFEELKDDLFAPALGLGLGGSPHAFFVADGAIDLLLPASATGAVSGEIIYQGPIKAPIKKGDQIATLRVKSADLAAVNEIPLYAGEDINSSGFASRGIDSLLVLAFGWLL